MFVVLDTNALYADPLLENAAGVALRDAAERLGYRLLLPQVVFDEAVQKQREKIVQATSKLKDAARLLDGYRLALPLDIPTDAGFAEAIDAAVLQYRSELAKLFVGDDRLPYPDDTQQSMAERALTKRRPFLEHDRGYRDTLLWRSILVRAATADDQIYLITGDHGFRRDRDTNELHPELIHEAEELGVPADRIQLLANLGEFVGQFILPQLEAIDEVKMALINHTLETPSDIEDEVGILLNESLYEVQFGSYKEPEYFVIDVIEDVLLASVDEVRRLPNGDIFARTVWSCSVVPDRSPYSYSSIPYSDDEGRYVDALATVDLVLDQTDNRLNTASIADFDILE